MAFPLEPEVAPIWAETALSSPDLVRPADGFIQAGWPLTAIPPSRGFFNWVLKFASNAVTYLMAWGLPNWQDDRVYATGSLVRGPDGAIYMVVGSATLALAPGADLGNWFLVLDALGFPTGRAIRWTESWSGSASLVAPGNTDFTGLETKLWHAIMVGPGAVFSIDSSFGGSPIEFSNLMYFSLGTTVGDRIDVLKMRQGSFRASNRIAMQWDVYPGTVAVAESQLFMGLSDGDLGTAGPVVASMRGGLFFTDASSGNWQAVVANGTTLGTAVDTGVAVAGAAWQHMRVEWTGAAFKFYINGGAPVATITTPSVVGCQSFATFGAKKLSGSGALVMHIGPVQYAQSY